MKKTIILTIALLSIKTSAQVIIGDAKGTAVNKTSVLLEFEVGKNKGLILPYVRTKPTNPAPGTLILNATTPTAANVEYWDGTTWISLGSNKASDKGDVTTALAKQPLTSEDIKGRAIIGATDSAADGVLVLESNTKAMVLPTVDDVTKIPSPAPGMMVYINKTGAKRLAFYNGNTWSFFAPQ